MRSIRSGADGVVVQVQRHFRLILNHHPVRSIIRKLRDISLDVASTPPGQEGLCCGVRQVCHCLPEGEGPLDKIFVPFTASDPGKEQQSDPA